jgi:hypothetical protein
VPRGSHYSVFESKSRLAVKDPNCLEVCELVLLGSVEPCMECGYSTGLLTCCPLGERIIEN